MVNKVLIKNPPSRKPEKKVKPKRERVLPKYEKISEKVSYGASPSIIRTSTENPGAFYRMAQIVLFEARKSAKQISALPGSIAAYLMMCYASHLKKHGNFTNRDNLIPDMDEFSVPGIVGLIFQHCTEHSDKYGTRYVFQEERSATDLLGMEIPHNLLGYGGPGAYYPQGNDSGETVWANTGVISVNDAISDFPSISELFESFVGSVRVGKISPRSCGDLVVDDEGVGPAPFRFSSGLSPKWFPDLLGNHMQQDLRTSFAVVSLLWNIPYSSVTTPSKALREAGFDPMYFRTEGVTYDANRITTLCALQVAEWARSNTFDENYSKVYHAFLALVYGKILSALPTYGMAELDNVSLPLYTDPFYYSAIFPAWVGVLAGFTVSRSGNTLYVPSFSAGINTPWWTRTDIGNTLPPTQFLSGNGFTGSATAEITYPGKTTPYPSSLSLCNIAPMDTAYEIHDALVFYLDISASTWDVPVRFMDGCCLMDEKQVRFSDYYVNYFFPGAADYVDYHVMECGGWNTEKICKLSAAFNFKSSHRKGPFTMRVSTSLDIARGAIAQFSARDNYVISRQIGTSKDSLATQWKYLSRSLNATPRSADLSAGAARGLLGTAMDTLVAPVVGVTVSREVERAIDTTLAGNMSYTDLITTVLSHGVVFGLSRYVARLQNRPARVEL